jgi:hypothetical protein
MRQTMWLIDRFLNFLRWPAPTYPLHYGEDVPVKGGGMTEYALVEHRPGWMWGLIKGKAIPFPSSNFEIATDEHQREVRELMKKRGYTVITKP